MTPGDKQRRGMYFGGLTEGARGCLKWSGRFGKRCGRVRERMREGERKDARRRGKWCGREREAVREGCRSEGKSIKKGLLRGIFWFGIRF